MPRILHCADLHLSEQERDYGLAVLREIVDLTNGAEAELLLFAGDVFDSYADMSSLRIPFRAELERARRACRIMMIPGNHELLRPGPTPITAMGFGRAELLAATPFDRREAAGVEIIAIPHQGSYAGYRDWPLPPRGELPRLALAHAALAGVAYLGPQQEEGGSAMDVDLLVRLEVDYAAMGHLHESRTVREGRMQASYPGSARVWRRGEYGARGVNLLELGAQSSLSRLPLRLAGEYHSLVVPLDLTGLLPELSGVWGEHDYLDVELCGLVEDERAAEAAREELRRRYGGAVRRLEVSTDGVTPVAGVAANPLAQRFVELWRERRAELEQQHGEQVARRVLEVGLRKIRAALGGGGR